MGVGSSCEQARSLRRDSVVFKSGVFDVAIRREFVIGRSSDGVVVSVKIVACGFGGWNGC